MRLFYNEVERVNPREFEVPPKTYIDIHEVRILIEK